MLVFISIFEIIARILMLLRGKTDEGTWGWDVWAIPVVVAGRIGDFFFFPCLFLISYLILLLQTTVPPLVHICQN
jgi:hypothetical protein